MEINPFSYLFSPEESKDLDKFAVESLSTSGEVLMSLASASIFSMYSERFKDYTILVVSGNGNNGGDGIVLSYLFYQSGYDVQVFLKDGKSSKEFLFHKCIAQQSKIIFQPLENLKEKFESCENNNILIIDSLFGTGFRGEIENEYLFIFKYIKNKLNNKNIRILNIDTPSGFSFDNESECFPIDILCEIGSKKIINQFAKIYAKEYSFFPIGFPIRDFVSRKKWTYYEIQDPNQSSFKESLEKQNDSNKYSNGSCSFFGGSRGMNGAIILSQSIFHALGGGISCIYTDSSETIIEVLKNDPSMMIKEIPDFVEEDSFFQKCMVSVIGPGLNENFKIPPDILEKKKFTVIDAGALKRINLFPLHELTLLTPHAGELNILAGEKLKTFEEKIHFIQSYCLEYNTNILLKGPVNILSINTGEIYIRAYSNPKLAVMGSGDLLTGILAYFYNRIGKLFESVQFSLFLLEICSKIPKKNPTAFELLKFLSERL